MYEEPMNKSFLSAFALAAVLLAASCSSDPFRRPEKPDYQLKYEVAGVSFEMTQLPHTHYTMGVSPDMRRKVTGGLAHEVALDGFVISTQPVSQELWTAVMGSNPASVQNPSYPVDRVTMKDVAKFVAKLNKLTGKVFLPPTEAQLEYAYNVLGTPAKNALEEWCLDPYADFGDETNGLSVNPAGPAKGDLRVVRTPGTRDPLDYRTKKGNLGFRLVQPTEDVLPEAYLAALDGATFEREAVDPSAGYVPEMFKVGDVSFKMVRVKGGTFKMGFTDSDAPYPKFNVPEDELPVHEVTLDDFAIGETEVTVELWNAVMGFVPYPNEVTEGRKPVGNVSWYMCQTFLEKLNALTGRKFRLPTEAEWEFAARGGMLSRHYGFSGSNDMNAVLVFLDNANMKLKNVATKRPNELGLYDMCGNAWEWCFDRYGKYAEAAQTNPAGAAEGDNRVQRGGSCASRWDACRISNRQAIPAQNVKGSFGFRLCL